MKVKDALRYVRPLQHSSPIRCEEDNGFVYVTTHVATGILLSDAIKDTWDGWERRTPEDTPELEMTVRGIFPHENGKDIVISIIYRRRDNGKKTD